MWQYKVSGTQNPGNKPEKLATVYVVVLGFWGLVRENKDGEDRNRKIPILCVFIETHNAVLNIFVTKGRFQPRCWKLHDSWVLANWTVFPLVLFYSWICTLQVVSLTCSPEKPTIYCTASGQSWDSQACFRIRIKLQSRSLWRLKKPGMTSTLSND